MRGAAVAVVLVIAVLLGAGAGYLLGNAGERTVTSVSTRTLPAVVTPTTTTATMPNLELFARIAPEVAAQGQNVSIITELYNPLPSSITLHASEIIDDSEAPCGLGIRAIGIHVYSGHYSLGNLSMATPLLLYNFSGPPPPCSIRFNNTYVFQPNSDNARVGYLSANTTLNVHYTDNLTGYWVNCSAPRPGDIGACADFQKFQPGKYTVLVFDAWGQQSIQYFEVKSLPTFSGIPKCGSTIVGNVTLTGNMLCSDKGLVLGADNTILDCAGHAISGTGAVNGSVGIYENGFNGVSVRNCVVSGFHYEFEFSNGSSNSLTNNVANSGRIGFYLHDEKTDRLSSNEAHMGLDYGFWLSRIQSTSLKNSYIVESTNDAFFIEYGSWNTFAANFANLNSYGFYLQGEHDDIFVSNLANTNTHDGFFLNSLTYNISLLGDSANSNRGFGFNDRSVGSGTTGTANSYSSSTPNICNGNNNGGSQSYPTGLC